MTPTLPSDMDARYELEVAQVSGRDSPENFHTIADTFPAGSSGTYTFYGEDGEPFAGSTFAFRVRADRADGTVTDYAGQTVVAAAQTPTLSALAIVRADTGRGDIQLDAGYAADPSDGTVVYEYQARPADGNRWIDAKYAGQGGWGNGPPLGPHTTASGVHGLTGGVAYASRVRALAGRSSSPWSAAATATATVPPSQYDDPRVVHPAVWATAGADGSLTVSWTPAAGSSSGVHYDLGVWQDGGVSAASPELILYWDEGGATSHTFPPGSAGAAGTVHFIEVDVLGNTGGPRGVPVAGYGSEVFTVPGTPAAVAPPVAPDQLTAVWNPNGKAQVDLHWHNTPGDEAGYLLYCSSGDTFGPKTAQLVANLGSDVTSYVDLNAPSLGTNYAIYAYGGQSPPVLTAMAYVATPAALPNRILGLASPATAKALLSIHAQTTEKYAYGAWKLVTEASGPSVIASTGEGQQSIQNRNVRAWFVRPIVRLFIKNTNVGGRVWFWGTVGYQTGYKDSSGPDVSDICEVYVLSTALPLAIPTPYTGVTIPVPWVS